MAAPLQALTCVPPVITSHPSGFYAVLPHGSQVLSVSATGTDLKYRWWFIWAISLTEGTEATTATTVVTPPYSRYYYLTVSNSCGEARSGSYICVSPLVTAKASWTGNPSLIRIWPQIDWQDIHTWPPTFQWYAGESGDVSHPLGSSGTDGIIINAASTSRSYWVRATTCTTYDSATLTVPAGAQSIPALSTLALVALAICMAGVALTFGSRHAS